MNDIIETDPDQYPVRPKKGHTWSLAFVKDRATRAVTRVPEIAYAVSRHWFAIVICIVIAAIAGWVFAQTRRHVYRGTVKLKVNPVASILGEQASYRFRDEMKLFMNTQTVILTSDSVLRKVAQSTGLDTPAEDAPLASESPVETVRRKIGQAKSTALEMLDLDEPRAGGFAREQALENAAETFRKRSNVVADPDSATITLEVYGADHARIRAELDGWVDAYITHVEDMDSTAHDEFFSNLLDYYSKLEKEAVEHLDAFKRDNPEVSEGELQWLEEQIADLKVRRGDLSRPGGGLGALVPGAGSGVIDPALASLTEALNVLTQQLIQKKAEGFREESQEVQKILRSRELVEKEIQQIRLGVDDPTSGDAELAAAQKRLEEQIAKRIESLTAELREKMVRRTALKEQLAERKRLEDDLQRIRDRRERYSSIRHDTLDMRESWKTVKVQRLDDPHVPSSPHEYRPLFVISLASLGGLGAGILLALVFEIFCRRVRFKHDLLNELDLRVVGVIPRR